MGHLYEAAFESPRMWLKIQASCDSQDQALAFFGSRFGSEVPSAGSPQFSFDVPFRLSERSESIANWEAIKSHLPDGWDDDEFRSAEDPSPWCETLSNNCDCHGIEGRLDIFYCSDLGHLDDVAKRASKSPNVRHFGWRKMMERTDANVERYDDEHLQAYRAAVLQMVKTAQGLEGEQNPDCLYLLVRVDWRNPRGEGVLTKVQRDFTDPTGHSHRISMSRFRNWDICLGIMDGLTDAAAE